MQIDIESRYLEQVKNIINTILKDQNLKIYVFGSRATGKAKKYSDLDVALMSDTKIDGNKMSEIIIKLEDTTIPYKVDVIDLREISETFKKCIENDLIQI